MLDELDGNHTPLQVAGIAEAVRGIGLGTSDVGDVTPLLEATEAPTRHAAITILAQQPASARTALEAVVADEDEVTTLRAAAAFALRGAGAQARSRLRRVALDDREPTAVRKAALRALAQVSTDGAGDVKDVAADASASWALRRVAIAALGDPAAQSSSALTTLLASKVVAVRTATIEALVTRGALADPTVVAAKLTDLSADVRYAALRGLVILGATAGPRTAIVGRMLDADPRIQALAAEVVGRTCLSIKATVRPTLVSLLASTNFNVRYHAALALHAHGDKSGAATMLADSLSPNPSVATQAKQAYRLITGQ